MSPSTSVRRAGIVTASALALSLGGAITASSASAASLTVCGAGEILTSTGKCVEKTVTSVAPKPSASSGGSTSGGSTGGSSGSGVNIPLPSLPSLPSGGSSGGSSGSSGGSSGGSGGGLNLPGLPSVPLPGLPGGGGGDLGGGSTPLPGPTVPGSTKGDTTASNDPSSVPGATPGTGTGGMLSPASAYLPASSILGFSSLSALSAVPTPVVSNMANIPSPLLADMPASQLAAVQAPMLAAGEDAAGGGTVLAAFGGYALPGLLVVLATAVVATVGAGNIRVWQARLAARRTA